MAKIRFFIDGKVKAKQSFKIGKNGFKYTPADVKEYANWVRICFKQAYPEHLPSVFFEKPLLVIINYYTLPPASWSNKKQEKALSSQIYPMVKPDCDNISKNICDALNGIAYPDDKQIVKLLISKEYSCNEKVEVRIENIL